MVSGLHHADQQGDIGNHEDAQTVKQAYQPDKVLDVRGWRCPWIALKAKSQLRRMRPGEILEVLSTDEQVRENFGFILKRGGDRILSAESDAEGHRLYIRRG